MYLAFVTGHLQTATCNLLQDSMLVAMNSYSECPLASCLLSDCSGNMILFFCSSGFALKQNFLQCLPFLVKALQEYLFRISLACFLCESCKYTESREQRQNLFSLCLKFNIKFQMPRHVLNTPSRPLRPAHTTIRQSRQHIPSPTIFPHISEVACCTVRHALRTYSL